MRCCAPLSHRLCRGRQPIVRGRNTQAPLHDKAIMPGACTGSPGMGTVGGGQPHNSMRPYSAINFCIAMEGLLPPHS